jgi:hypothetical protein
MRELTAKEYGLKPAFGHAPLRVVHSCSGEYTCSCAKCSEDRKLLVDSAARRAA